MQTAGIHHVTAVAGDAQKNLDFYTGVLGQRLVKRTVNFDDPSSYHLYYGNEAGQPGTIMTFFPFPGARRGRPGAGNVVAASYAIPSGSIDDWRERLTAEGVSVTDEKRFDHRLLALDDPDGMRIELIEADAEHAPWTGASVPADQAIRGFHSVTLLEHSLDATAAMLVEQLGFKPGGTEGNRHRFRAAGASANVVDVLVDASAPRGVHGAGVVHHVAFRSPDDATQQRLLDQLQQARIGVSPVMDRNYFHSIYFREAGGVLFELATDAPGFAVDEPLESLGAALKLPPQYEPQRARIEALLPNLRLQ